MRKGKIVVGTTDADLFGAKVGLECKVLRSYFYNGETWFQLEDLETAKVFDSPTVFWAEKE